MLLVIEKYQRNNLIFHRVSYQLLLTVKSSYRAQILSKKDEFLGEATYKCILYCHRTKSINIFLTDLPSSSEGTFVQFTENALYLMNFGSKEERKWLRGSQHIYLEVCREIPMKNTCCAC
jgi:hypothetical protein